LCASAADVHHLTRASRWPCRPKEYLHIGSPSLGQPFNARRTSTCVVKYGILILDFDEVVEDWEISNATRVVPMAGL
jgi:hypothetical protein